MTASSEPVDILTQACFDWHGPDAMIALADRLGAALDDDAMFRRGRTFREAHVAGRFAHRRDARRVRLLKEDGKATTPDFELEADGRLLRFETTEADAPGRRRQDEYRHPGGDSSMDLVDRTVMIDHMRTLAAAKAARGYAACHGLVIWMNAFTDPQMRWDDLLRGSAPAAGAFVEIWAMGVGGALLWLDAVAQPCMPDTML